MGIKYFSSRVHRPDGPYILWKLMTLAINSCFEMTKTIPNTHAKAQIHKFKVLKKPILLYFLNQGVEWYSFVSNQKYKNTQIRKWVSHRRSVVGAQRVSAGNHLSQYTLSFVSYQPSHEVIHDNEYSLGWFCFWWLDDPPDWPSLSLLCLGLLHRIHSFHGSRHAASGAIIAVKKIQNNSSDIKKTHLCVESTLSPGYFLISLLHQNLITLSTFTHFAILWKLFILSKYKKIGHL